MLLKIFTIVGARPQFVKAGAFSRALRGMPDLQECLVHTGQHFDAKMSDVFFQDLQIPEPAYNLAINNAGHGEMTGKMLQGIEEILLREKPHAVMVYGDTNSTLAGALAASKLHIPVIHQEAGLRSFNKRMPEEINRVLTDHVSSLLLCPTRAAVDNLKQENITKNVHHVGDVMYDATLYAKELAVEKSDILAAIRPKNPYALVTIHRAENTDNPQMLARVFAYIDEVRREQGLDIIFPLHPRTRKLAAQHGLDMSHFHVCEPVGYLDMHRLLMEAQLVLTDSGGLQKEAYFHQKPCVTLRSETEWVETISAGWNRLWTCASYVHPRLPIDDYGTGRASDISGNLMGAFLRDFYGH